MRVGRCRDCGAAVAVAGETGSLPKRCETCREERARALARERSARWRAAHPERARDAWTRYNRWRQEQYEALRTAMGSAVSIEMSGADGVEALVEAQEGCCAVCGEPQEEPKHSLCVDLDASGRIRGLLCFSCQTVVALIGDDEPVRRLLLVAKYLTE